MRTPLLALLVIAPATARAVTANVCVRNDGVGTFSAYDLDLFADSDWNAGDRTGSGPSSGSIAPGQGTCISMTGLTQWNGYQYQYRFDITFTDTNGPVTFSSPPNLQLTST